MSNKEQLSQQNLRDTEFLLKTGDIQLSALILEFENAQCPHSQLHCWQQIEEHLRTYPMGIDTLKDREIRQ